MNIGICGAGWVGLVTAAGFASTGNTVIVYDIDPEKIYGLRYGGVPFYEPGMTELADTGRIRYVDDIGLLEGCDIVFLTVGTPPAEDGSADLTALTSAAEALFQVMRPDTILAVKSTVPPGTCRRLSQLAGAATDRPVNVLSNPEFLAEGRAVDDFLRPARIVIGADHPEDAEPLVRLYQPFARRTGNIIVTSLESAELTKYAANVFLAVKISYINEVANLCDLYGADIDDVRQGMVLDPRIGDQFLYPGIGYGGSCFPKDVDAAIRTAKHVGYHFRSAIAAADTNQHQADLFFWRASREVDGLRDKTVAIWGAAFKPGTDDIRESRGIILAQLAQWNQADVRIYDPHALAPAQDVLGDDRYTYWNDPYAAAEDADLLLIATEHSEIQSVDLTRLHKIMRQPVVFDGRNVYQPAEMKALGFTYQSVGRPTH